MIEDEGLHSVKLTVAFGFLGYMYVYYSRFPIPGAVVAYITVG